jgi:hypothetical protein
MKILISNPGVIRSTALGFQTHSFNQVNGLKIKEAEMVVVEPAFTDFATATNEQLSVPFAVGAALADLPNTLVVAISYSRKNAATYKGYLLEMVEFFKQKGYTDFSSFHVPFETYGVPMVGSSLFFVFKKNPFAYAPEKKTVFPGDIYQGLLYHAPNGRSSGSIHPGTAVMNGFLTSSRSFLPALASWANGVLRCEYKAGDSTVVEVFRKESICELFGVSSYQSGADLALCTPAVLLESLKTITDLKKEAKAPPEPIKPV